MFGKSLLKFPYVWHHSDQGRMLPGLRGIEVGQQIPLAGGGIAQVLHMDSASATNSQVILGLPCRCLQSWLLACVPLCVRGRVRVRACGSGRRSHSCHGMVWYVGHN